jgi:uncharacterized alkaline shock family protein YloU
MKEFLQNLCPENSHCCWQLTVVAACGVVFLWLLCAMLRSRRVFVTMNGEGTISLTKCAIGEIVRSVARDIGIGEKVQTKIRSIRQKISIDITIKANSWRNLSEMSHALNNRIRSVLVDDIGLISLNKINVIVVGFSPGKCFARCQCERKQSNCSPTDCASNDENCQ